MDSSFKYNKVVFEGMAKNKDKFEWLAENEFSLKIGNAGAVKLNLNDKDLGSLERMRSNR